MIARALFAALLAMGAGACQSTFAETPAVLVSADAETIGRLKAALAVEMGDASIELGPGDLTQTSIVSVLPPPPGPREGNSPAMPTRFDLVLRGDACFARRRDSGADVALPGVACRPAAE